MATSPIKNNEYKIEKSAGKSTVSLPNKIFNTFTADILGLGDLSTPSKSIDAVAAIFDLEGFTNFCKQIEPHLSVPRFLNEFTKWILESLRNLMVKKKEDDCINLWARLPFFCKFMGDGLLILWDVTDMSDVERRNIIVACNKTCDDYAHTFFPKIKKMVTEVPKLLRCGIARGTVYSVGDGQDFVGSCINMASRLQKIHGANFAFNSRGFEIDEHALSKVFFGFVQKEVAIRGIGEHELICIPAAWFNSASIKTKKNFADL